MRIFRTLRTRRASFSTDDGSISFTAPKSWKELTQDQLRYAFTVMSLYDDPVQVKTLLFVRFCGIHVVRKDRFGWQCFVRTTWWGKRKFFTLQTWQIEDLIKQFGYIDQTEQIDNRLDVVGKLRAVDLWLHGVRFLDYLNAEKYYQNYMASRNDEMLRKLALILYRKKNGGRAEKIKMSGGELLGTILWYSSVKHLFSRAFPHFFRKINPEQAADFNIMQSFNAQVRALTDGDVTKEQEIFDTDCWRALTELDQKAREAKEIKDKMRRNKKNGK